MNSEQNKKWRTGMAGRLRMALKELKEFSKNDVYCHLDQLSPFSIKDEKSFENAWDEFRKRNEIVRLGKAHYRHNPIKSPKYDVREKIFRAMHIRSIFCAHDIKLLTDADQSYISATIRKLVNQGWLSMVGINGKHKIFQVVDLDEFYLEFVRIK